QWFQIAASLLGGVGFKIKLPAGWIEREFRYQAIRLGKWGFAAIPGEAIHAIALDLKSRGAMLGFERTFTCGLANGHMSYVCTTPEYAVGGYEAVSSFFGATAGDRLVDSVQRQLTKVKP